MLEGTPELQPEKRNHGEDSVVAAAKGKAPNPTLPPTNPSRQNPIPKPLPTAPNPSQEWTTVTHKRKKQNTQKQPLVLTENTVLTTETAPQVVLDVGNIASSSKQPILTQILTEIGFLPTETVIPASLAVGNTSSPSNQRFSATISQKPSRPSMAIPATGRPPPEVGHHPPIPAHPLNYSNVLKSSPTTPFLPSPETAINGRNPSPCGNASPMSSSIPIKPIVYLHGEPTVRFEKKEVEVMIHQQNLNLAVIGKFSHGWPEIGLLRTAIPKQCGLKAEVNIGLLCDRHVLIRCTIAEDYDTLMSRQTFEIKEKNKPYLMRTFKWDVTFNPDEETRFAYGWISFPGLPPHFHGESSLFSMAASVGIPISIDSATRNKTRPSSARVKVEVDLLKVHPKSVLIQVGEGAEITSTQQRIRYDFLPKYCTNCKLQGHDSIGCWKLNPELRPNKENPAVARGLTAAGGEKSKSHHLTHPPLSSTSHPTNSEWQTVNHRRKTTGKGNPNPPQNTKNPSNSLETPIPATGTVNTTSLAVGNTVQATENTILQKNTFFEISDAGNPTGILGGAGNPTGTLCGAGDPTGTLPAPSPVQAAHPPETLAAVWGVIPLSCRSSQAELCHGSGACVRKWGVIPLSCISSQAERHGSGTCVRMWGVIPLSCISQSEVCHESVACLQM
ncbi:hypothetical protein RND71_037551 [Anisodus tanguticus]|uniref:DUF4283 domain-containing protein n=1 Tax=Anisodus tanguticus TaxID=243964 RepID=A0AAE1QY03_9SOLA|nr:hypothetical protein RND71_037551 [Anisodus tanguticus]